MRKKRFREVKLLAQVTEPVMVQKCIQVCLF